MQRNKPQQPTRGVAHTQKNTQRTLLHRSSPAQLLELPVPIVQRAHVSALEPALDAVKVKGVVCMGAGLAGRELRERFWALGGRWAGIGRRRRAAAGRTPTTHCTAPTPHCNPPLTEPPGWPGTQCLQGVAEREDVRTREWGGAQRDAHGCEGQRTGLHDHVSANGAVVHLNVCAQRGWGVVKRVRGRRPPRNAMGHWCGTNPRTTGPQRCREHNDKRKIR